MTSVAMQKKGVQVYYLPSSFSVRILTCVAVEGLNSAAFETVNKERFWLPEEYLNLQ